MEYFWRARTLRGDLQTGVLAARSEAEVIGYLRRQSLIVVAVRPRPREISLPRLRSAARMRDLVLFTRQFATMIGAGLPLVQCLEILAAQAENPRFRSVVLETQRDVEAGTTLSAALRRHGRVFPNLYVNMVAAGEAGGVLEKILTRLAVYLEKSSALRRKVKGAMVYPGVILTVAVGVTFFLLVFIIPTFARLFESTGMTLPLPTRIVIGISAFLLGSWHILLLVAFALGLALRQAYRTSAGRLSIDRLLLQTPQIGPVLRKSAIARFARTLGTLIGSGVPILEAMEITAFTTGNRVIQGAILAARASIAQGDTLAEPLRRCGVFPPMVTQMINVGERTGELERMLEKVSDFYEEEVDVAVATLTSILEPVMIVIMGILVGGMLIAMYLPIFRLASAIR